MDDKDRRIAELEKTVEDQDIEIRVLKKLNSILTDNFAQVVALYDSCEL